MVLEPRCYEVLLEKKVFRILNSSDIVMEIFFLAQRKQAG